MTDHANIARNVKNNLEQEHNWSEIRLHFLCSKILLSGFPPKRLYVHPDEQIKAIRIGHSEMKLPPETEWVLPMHISQFSSITELASIFDSLPHKKLYHRQNHLLAAIVHDDSTIVYYIIHDGLVKPRQN